MAILGKFEVTILTPDISQTHNAATKSVWVPAQEYVALDSDTYHQGTVYSKKYIAAPPSTDKDGFSVPTDFAIDFKTFGPVHVPDDVSGEYLVFRVLHDDYKIGSAHVKREMWKRRLTYRVRKTGRRHWVQEQHTWVEQKWQFDEGSHGTLRIEVWWEGSRTPCAGAWNHPNTLPVLANEYREYVDLEDPSINKRPIIPRVRHASKLGIMPVAEFVFEYRSEDTLQSIGIVPALPQTIPIYDLTSDDESRQAEPLERQVIDLSSSFASTPSKNTTENCNSYQWTDESNFDRVLGNFGNDDFDMMALPIYNGMEVEPDCVNMSPPLRYPSFPEQANGQQPFDWSMQSLRPIVSPQNPMTPIDFGMRGGGGTEVIDLTLE